MIAFWACGGADGSNVGARAGLAQREGGDLLASRLGKEVPLPLGFAAPLQERQAVQSHVYRHDDAGGAVHPLQFLAGQRQGEIVHPCSAVAHGKTNAQEADGGHLGQQAAVKRLLAVEFLDDGADLLLSEVAHRLANHLVFGREREIHGLLVSSALSECARCDVRLTGGHYYTTGQREAQPRTLAARRKLVFGLVLVSRDRKGPPTPRELLALSIHLPQAAKHGPSCRVAFQFFTVMGR